MGSKYEEANKVAAKNHHDFMMGISGWRTGGVWNKIGFDNSAWGSNRYTPSGSSVVTADDVGNYVPAVPSQPFLPGVDRWLENIPGKVFATLGGIGALAGFGYGMDTGGWQDGLLNACVFGFAGFILLHALAKLFKLAVGLLMVAVAAGICYLMFRASTH